MSKAMQSGVGCAASAIRVASAGRARGAAAAAVLAGTAVLLSAAPPASAATQPVLADTYVASGAATTAQGGANILVDNTSTGNANRRWTYISYAVPATPVTAASLSLYNTTFSTTSAGTIDVYGLTANKLTAAAESTLTWTNDPNRDGTTTPNKLVFANTFNQAPLTTFTSATKTAAGPDTVFNVTSGPVLDYLNANLGGTVTFVIYGQERTDNTGWAWASKETAVAGTVGPTLNVTTAVPEPATAGLAGVAGMGLLAARRRRSARGN